MEAIFASSVASNALVEGYDKVLVLKTKRSCLRWS